MAQVENARSIASDDQLWTHFCAAERLPLMVGSGERCSWCDCSEDDTRRPARARPLLRALVGGLPQPTPALAH